MDGRLTEDRRQAARAQMRGQWQERREATGEALGYYGCHRRVRTERGRAADRICHCGKPAQHWAHIHDTDPTDPSNYEAMCAKCHFAYDKVGDKIRATAGRRSRSEGALRMHARRSPEERSAIVRKAWEKRRANAAMAVRLDGSG